MTSLPSARRRAEEFADAVDSVLAPRGAPASAAATSGLLDLVLALSAVPAPSPRPEFTADLRQRLLTEAATLLTASGARPVVGAETGRDPRQSRRRQGRIVAAATAFAVVGGSAGVATAAQHALPGEALYPIKRALEGAELRLSTSDAGRGRDLLEQASSRLDELRALLPVTAGSGGASGPVAERVPVTVLSFTSQAVEGSGLLLDAFEDDRDPRTVVEVRAFATESVGTLSELAAVAPSDVREELLVAAAALQSIDRLAVELCAACGDGAPPLQIPSDFGEPAEDDVVGGAGSGDGADGDTTSADGESAGDDGSAETSDRDGRGADGSGTGDQPGPSGGPTGQDGAQPEPSVDGEQATDGIGTGTPDGVTDGPVDSPDDPTDLPTDVPTDVPTEDPTGDPDGDPTGDPDGEPTGDPGSEPDPDEDPDGHTGGPDDGDGKSDDGSGDGEDRPDDDESDDHDDDDRDDDGHTSDSPLEDVVEGAVSEGASGR